MNALIRFILIVISLSLINERIVNLLKYYFFRRWIEGVDQPIADNEPSKRNKIFLLSALSGVIVSALLVTLVAPETINKSLSLDSDGSYHWQLFGVTLFIGLLTGSLSSLLHDIFEVLNSIKKTKRYSESQTKEAIKMLKDPKSDFIQLPPDEQQRLIHDCIVQQGDLLKQKYPEISGMSAYRKQRNDAELEYYSLTFDIQEKRKDLTFTEKLPAEIEYIDGTKTYRIPTDVMGVGVSEMHGFTDDGQMPRKLGIGCAIKGSSNVGTIGLKVYKNGVAYLMTCYHVLCRDEMDEGVNSVNYAANGKKKIVVSPAANSGFEPVEIAEVSEGIYDEFRDIALARLNDPKLLDNAFYDYNGAPNGFLEVESSHNGKLKLRLYGLTSGFKEGILKNSYKDIIYLTNKSTGRQYKYYNLISAGKMSEPGDSGASVTDDQNRLIGILVGGNDVESFIMPINIIFNKFNLDKNLT